MAKRERFGEIEIGVGPMFSKKSDYLLTAVDQAKHIDDFAQAFIPTVADRGEGPFLVSRWVKDSYPAVRIDHSSEILDKLDKSARLVVIDEAQFLDAGIIQVVRTLAYQHHLRVVIAGLPNDFRGEPFGPMPQLLAIADRRTDLTAACGFQVDGDSDKCPERATRTQRLINGEPAPYDSPIIVIGDKTENDKKEHYVARCPRHHIVPGRP